MNNPKLLLMLASSASIALGSLQVLALANPLGIGWLFWLIVGGGTATVAVQDFQENGSKNLAIIFALISFVGVSLWLPTSSRFQKIKEARENEIPARVYPVVNQ